MELSVEDNGVGLPKGFDIAKTETLGLRLVHTLSVEQLRGTLDVHRKGGTRFMIRFQA